MDEIGTSLGSALGSIGREVTVTFLLSIAMTAWGAVLAYWKKARADQAAKAAESSATTLNKLLDAAGGFVDQLMLTVASNPTTLAAAAQVKDVLVKRFAGSFADSFTKLGATAAGGVDGAERVLMRVLADRLVKGDVTAALGNLAASPASTITEEGAKAAATVLQGMVEVHATQAPVESTATTGTGILAKITGG